MSGMKLERESDGLRKQENKYVLNKRILIYKYFEEKICDERSKR